MSAYWVRSHITRNELAKRFNIGDKLIEEHRKIIGEQQTYHNTVLSWQQCIEKYQISRDQSIRYIKVARRFSPEQRKRVVELELPWRFVETLTRIDNDAHVNQFLSASSSSPTIDQCLSLLQKIVIPEKSPCACDEASSSTMPVKETTQAFLGYLEDTIGSMRRYLAEHDK